MFPRIEATKENDENKHVSNKDSPNKETNQNVNEEKKALSVQEKKQQQKSQQQENPKNDTSPFKIKFHIFILPEFKLDKNECQIGIYTNLTNYDMKKIIVFDNIR